MANVKIIDLPTGSPESDSFLEATQVNEQAASGRSSAKIAFNALANWIAGQGADPVEYGDLNTEDETLIGGINELHNTIGAEAYDDTATYNTGDYCIHNGELYKCNDDNVTGAWNSAKWDLTKVVDELGGGGGNADFIECTQAEYDAMEQAGTLDPTVMYFITDGQSGGSSTLAGLSDVNLTNPTDGQLLRYNGTSGKWENAGIIDDSTTSTSKVWSSKKTNTELALKQDELTTTTPTCAYTISIQSGGINAYKYGKILIVTGWLMPTYDKVANDTIAYVSGERVAAVFFASPNSSNGLNGRLKMTNQNNQIEIVCESALKSTDYYSFTFVGVVQ